MWRMSRRNPEPDTERLGAGKENGMETERFMNSDYGHMMTRQEGKTTKSLSERRLFMRKNFSFFGGASILYAVFLTFCLYRNASGITYPFFVAGTLVYFYLCTKKSGVPWKADGIFYLASIELLGISVFLTDNVYILFFTKMAIFLLMLSMALHQYLDERGWTFSKYLTALCQGLLETVGCIASPVNDGMQWLKEREKERNGKGRYILLGLLILLPLLVVILLLLMTADAVFGRLISNIVDYLRIWDVICILFMIAAAFFLSYSFIAMLNEGAVKENCTKKKEQEPVLAITFTSVITAVYLIFCGIQVIYLFLQKGDIPGGYSYASYARQGFFQLLAVCIINLAIVLICLSLFRESKVLKAILTVLSLCTYVMIASSAYRMLLYIGYRQLTFLRILVLWALAVLCIMLAGVIYSIFRPGFSLFRYLLAVLTVCYIILAFAKPDYWTAKYNMSFVNRGTEALQSPDEEFYEDFSYLAHLSADAAPVLASDENYFYLRQRSGDMMEYYERMENRAEKIGIRNFNLSRYLAGQAVEKMQQAD